jgi:hypothetical protein
MRQEEIEGKGSKQPILDKLMQPVGIVLLLLMGLSGSQDLLGKKRAWLCIEGTWLCFRNEENQSHFKLHSFSSAPEINLSQETSHVKAGYVQNDLPLLPRNPQGQPQLRGKAIQVRPTELDEHMFRFPT